MGRRRRRRGRRRGDASSPEESPRTGPDVGLLGAIPAATLDLHGLRADAAERRVTDFLATQARIHGGRVVHVITGSGLGSPGGPVLRGRVGELLDGPLARFVTERRLDLHRGGWLVRLP